MTPDQIHFRQADTIHAARQTALDAAFLSTPERFGGMRPKPPKSQELSGSTRQSKRASPSLNSKPKCLKVVDTFRGGAVVLRKTLLVSLDDLLAVIREFLYPQVSRSGLDRCLRRHGVGNLRDLQAQSPRPKHTAFKACEPGYLHVDGKCLPQMAAGEADQKTVRGAVYPLNARRYLFVAIDRATWWVFIRIYNSKTAANARRFLRDLERACPMKIRTIPTQRAVGGAIDPSPMTRARSSPTARSACASVLPPASPNSISCAATIRHCRSDQWRDMAHHRPPPCPAAASAK